MQHIRMSCPPRQISTLHLLNILLFALGESISARCEIVCCSRCVLEERTRALDW
jgi:hypothetical protein